jgi:hypothetical protein
MGDEIYRELFEWLSRPPSGYENHSCDNCTVSGDCLVSGFIEDTSAPNSCSFYWPPNAGKEPSEWYWKQLNQVKERFLEAKIGTALKRDGVLVVETGDKDIDEMEAWIIRMKQSISNDQRLMDDILKGQTNDKLDSQKNQKGQMKKEKRN